jgi:hypothetical protein
MVLAFATRFVQSSLAAWSRTTKDPMVVWVLAPMTAARFVMTPAASWLLMAIAIVTAAIISGQGSRR